MIDASLSSAVSAGHDATKASVSHSAKMWNMVREFEGLTFNRAVHYDWSEAFLSRRREVELAPGPGASEV